MTQSRKIAIIYVFAVPAVLLVILFERVAVLRVGSVETGMAKAGAVLRICDRAAALLKESELRPASVPGGAVIVPDQAVVSQFSDALQQVRELTRDDAAAQSQFRTLDLLVAERSTLLKSAMESMKNQASASSLADMRSRDQKLAGELANLISEIRKQYEIGLEQQGQTASQSVHSAGAAILYGGFLTLWLVGVAAVLLFHDERARAWTGVERRVHTRILQELPIGICLTTGGGVILYSNQAEDALLGYEPGELIGRNVAGFVSPTDADPAFDDVIDRLPPNRTWSGELGLHKKDRSFVEAASWVTNLEVAGKFYRLYIHNPEPRPVPAAILEAASRVN